MRRFSSLGALARHLEAVVEQMSDVEETALAAIGSAVVARAQEKIGHYQEGIPPFEAWPALAPATIAEKTMLGYAPPDNPLLRRGALRDSYHFVVTRGLVAPEVTAGTGDPVGLWQEMGTSTIPPRPVVGPAMLETMPANLDILAKGIRSVIRGER